MKNRIQPHLLLSFLMLFLFQAAHAKESYNITIKIKGLEKQEILLGYYYGDKQYIRDSARCDATGKVVFKGKDSLDGGIYLIASKDRRLLFDFVITEQIFSLETDTIDYVGNMKVKGSAENETFFSYSAFTSKMGRRAMDLDRKYKEAKEKNDTLSARLLRDQLRNIDDSVDQYRRGIMQDHPGFLMSKIFRMMQEIDVPEPPKLPNGATDSLFGYYFYRNAYINQIDFTDDRLVRTPVFFQRIQTYITRITPQIPDTIAAAAFDVCDRALGRKEMQKWLIYWITNHYETSEYMGMDKVFVLMADRYYANKEATYWVDEALRFKITDRANQLRYSLIGSKPLNLSLPDSALHYQTLFNIKADYTVLVFWDPHCGRCKEELPRLLELYGKLNGTVKKEKRIEVYAMASTNDYPEWRKYIREHKLPWINVHDPNKESNYHRYYDIYSTPVVYLLGKDKRIIAKRLSIEQVADFIEKGIE
ncbi:MAG: thioredoxin-like domain-containing protein [Bacteroidia bacterium]|jgi:thiol-disulfide isomerase/thioredoxin